MRKPASARVSRRLGGGLSPIIARSALHPAVVARRPLRARPDRSQLREWHGPALPRRCPPVGGSCSARHARRAVCAKCGPGPSSLPQPEDCYGSKLTENNLKNISSVFVTTAKWELMPQYRLLLENSSRERKRCGPLLC